MTSINYDILSEDPKKGSKYYESVAVNYYEEIKEYRTGIHGLIGPYGSGKSSLLEAVNVLSQTEGNDYFLFDAREFPNRKDMWEGFIIKLVLYLENKNIKDAILGNINDYNSDVGKLIRGVVTTILPGSAAWFEGYPLSRIFEMQQLLYTQIKDIKKNIYIILEDIDRSGDEGIFFLETLNNFLRAYPIDKKIVCITPISNRNFNDQNMHQHFVKTFSSYTYFNSQNDIGNFISDLLVDGDEDVIKGLTNFMNRILSKEYYTMREVKLNFKNILTDETVRYINENGLDVGLYLLIHFTKYRRMIPIASTRATHEYIAEPDDSNPYNNFKVAQNDNPVREMGDVYRRYRDLLISSIALCYGKNPSTIGHGGMIQITTNESLLKTAITGDKIFLDRRYIR